MRLLKMYMEIEFCILLLGGTTLIENSMREMTFSEKYSFEGWILKVNLVLGTINMGRYGACSSVTDCQVS